MSVRSDSVRPASPRIHGTIARDIGVAILRGTLLPGETLSGEIEGAAGLGVSRGAYREAIRILVAKGMVQSRPKTGTRVCPRRFWNMLDADVLTWTFEAGPSPAFLQDLFELRIVVEPAAAGFAARRRDGRDLARMGHALEEMEAHPQDSRVWGAADARFHDAILVASRNELLVSLASSIAAALRWMAEYKAAINAPLDLQAEHRAVYDAIVAADAGQARAAMVTLIQSTREEVRAEMPDRAMVG